MFEYIQILSNGCNIAIIKYSITVQVKDLHAESKYHQPSDVQACMYKILTIASGVKIQYLVQHVVEWIIK